MNCDQCQRRILEAPGPTPESVEIAAHLEACPVCREIAVRARTEADAPGAAVPDDLLPSILERTGGPACGGAVERLCEFVDGALASEDTELVALHLAGCPACSALSTALEFLPDELSGLAEIPPDPRFVGEVLAATVGRRRRFATDRIASLWQILVGRPRLAWELAYIGTMVFWLAVGVPGPSFGSETDTPSLPRPGAVYETVRTDVASAGTHAWNSARGSWGRLESRLVARYENTSEPRQRLRRDGATLGQATLALDWREGRSALRDLGRDAHAILTGLVIPENTTARSQP